MNKRKLHIHYWIYIVIFCSLFTGCREDRKYKVAYLYPSKDFPRFVKEGGFMSERLKQLGADVKIVDGEGDEAIQLSKGLKLLDDEIDLLIITALNGNTIAPLVREAKDRGIPVMAYNRLINNVDYDLYFTGNNEDIGRIFCETALSLKPHGNYVILAGDRFDRNGVELKEAIDSLLKPHVANGNVNIVYESYIENWDRDNAMNEMAQVIESHGTDIDVVISCYDPMAEGVISVLKKYEIDGNVVVTGQDADLNAIKRIMQGSQTLTVYHPCKVLGYKAAELAFAILNGQSAKTIANARTFNGLEMIPTMQVKSVAIKKDNIEKELVEVGEYTWDQINN